MMEWYLALLIMLGTLVFFLATGLPIAFSFMLVNVIAVLLWWGGIPGLERLVIATYESVSNFVLLPVVLFLLLGEVMLQSGMAPLMIEALDKWLGRIPGRLSLLSLGAGALFSTLTGEPVASVAMLGTTLVPEMEKKGYKRTLALGSIMGSAGLAMLIPPSSLAVFVGAIGRISIGQILIGMIPAGLMLAVLLSAYIITVSKLRPSIAPPYDMPSTSIMEKIIPTVKYVLPAGLVIFLIIGVIFLGIATPSEAAATGCVGIFILAALYKKLSWEVVKKSFTNSTQLVVMVFIIIATAKVFGQNLAYTGASKGLVDFTAGLPLSPIAIFIAIQFIVIIMGMFMEPAAIIMISLPLFVPVIHALGFDLVWFAIVFLVNIQLGFISPPFGFSLFVMKAVAPPGTTMGEVYRAAIPFCLVNLAGVAILIAFPIICTWLPALMITVK